MAKEVAAMARCRAVDEAISRGDSEVQAFFKDAVVFITGGSGFLGKHLIEKLFRSCDIKRVYILMRSKKGHASQERIGKIFQDVLYDGLHKLKPDFVSRVTAVQGDITQVRLGLSDQDWYTLANEVNVIFHAAATTTFNEPLRTASNTNIRGTIEAIKLGKDCKNLKSFVHVSTAYTHATPSRVSTSIKEDFFERPEDPNIIMDLVDLLSDEKLETIKEKLIEEWPNTYSFTKALAEEAIRTMSGDLPICILRPAIVISSYLEPRPGWVDISSVYGPSGLVFGSALGVMHTFLANNDAAIDLIPVDFVNNAAIAAAWATGKRHINGKKDIQIYTVSPARNPIKWRRLMVIMYTDAIRYPSPKAVWYIFSFHTKYRMLFLLLSILFHFVPAFLADGVLLLLGKKPKALKICRTAYNLSEVLSFYTCNEFFFQDQNLVKLQHSMSKTDREIYDFDVENINWNDLSVLWNIGIRKYIVKDGLQYTKYALNKQKLFRILNYVVGVLYFYALYKLFSCVLGFGMHRSY